MNEPTTFALWMAQRGKADIAPVHPELRRRRGARNFDNAQCRPTAAVVCPDGGEPVQINTRLISLTPWSLECLTTHLLIKTATSATFVVMIQGSGRFYASPE